MNDLSDLVWSQPEKKKSPPQLPKKPANLTSNATPKTTKDDVFGNLVDFQGQSKPDISKLSLAEQQQQSSKMSTSFTPSMSPAATLSPQLAQYSSSPRSSGYNSDVQRVLEPTSQRPATHNKPTGDAFDSLLDPLGDFGRSSGSKSPSNSLNAMRSQSSTPSNLSERGQGKEHQWNLDLFDQTYMKSPERSTSASPAPPASLDPFDMDPFEPSNLSQTSVKANTIETVDDSDNPLGILAGPPVKAQKSPPPRVNTPPPASRDHLVKQVIEMGFTREQALNALDATENGTDVSLAIDLLLQDRESVTPSPQRPPRSPSTKQRSGANETARQMLWGDDSAPAPRTSRKASPRIQQEDVEERHNSPQDKNAAFQHQKEKIVSQASELGGFLYKNASLFVKSSREKVEKYMTEMQTAEGDRSKARGTGGGGPSRPKWMTDAPDDHLQYDVEKEQQRGKFEKYADESSDEDPEEEKRKEEEFRLERERQRKRYIAEQKASKAKQQQLLDTSDNYVSPSRRRNPTPSGRSTPQSPNPNVTPRQAASPKPVTPPAKQRAKRRVVEASSFQVESANDHKQQGNDFFKLGQYSEAEQAYSQAIMQLPERHDHLIILHNNRAAAFFKNGEYKRAVEDSNIVVQLIGNDHMDDTSVHTIQGASISMRDQAVKAILRKAQALENMEKFADAITEYNMLTKIDGGKNTTQIHQGLGRCRKSISGAHKAETMQKAPVTNGHSSNPFSVDFDPINAPAAPVSAKVSKVDVDKSEAVKQMRAKAAQQDAEEEQRLKVVDDVDRRLAAWKNGKEKNLRALLASLDTILWPEATWKGANMSELIDPKRCKITYMKAIAKVHPDKLGSTVTVEQKMLASGIFGTLNEAWDMFKAQNGL
ncbi:hypothetical protein INT44_001692 [Umbelopsis vinacea]|uniref:UBA domain-containing protein n=1 Tax=Umbelopsis vinacea TaxID=44442 RepID=A0A8H7UGN1_9FUNG|nr:hypothetical protein INT44_001692 [Umbelopsis vinacea]